MTAPGYHQRTKHSPASMGGGGYLDWANKPLPFKFYPDLEPIYLPVELPESTLPAAQVLSGLGRVEPVALDLAQVARMLFYSAGVTRRIGRGEGTIFFRAAPSAGALYPIELYVVCGSLPGLEAGVYHFGPIDFTLRRMRDGDLRGVLAEAAADEELGRAAAVLVLTGIPWRTTWKYRERGYRHLFWDSGTILANLLSVAEAAGLPCRLVGGFVDDEVSALLDLGEPQELPLVLVPLGSATHAAVLAPPPEPLGLAVQPLSPQPLRSPLLEEAHQAGALKMEDQVAAWRRAGAELGPVKALEQVGRATEERSATIEDVILQRGSARRFSRGTISGDALLWCLAAAGRAVTADFVAPGRSLVERLLAVHAVEGVPAGAYRWERGDLQRIHEEASRRRTAYLCLGQALGGDAAVTVFLSSPLREVLGRLGDRGYRMAQLEAGIVSGWLHLAAYALGLGATGLTFFDDEVKRFFDTESEPMLVTALGVPDYRARPGKRPHQVRRLRLTASPSG